MLWINRFLQGTKSVYPYIVFVILVCEFFITFPLMLYPPIAISMVLVGIFSLIAMVFFYKLLCFLVNLHAVRLLRASVCPKCEAHTVEPVHHESGMQPTTTSDMREGPHAAEPLNGYRCGHCRTVFTSLGGAYDPAMHPLDTPVVT